VNILWLDDDAPKSPRNVGEVHVIPARTCAEAAQILEQGERPPEWIVVDLIVPQDSWGEGYLRMPGLEFIKYVKATYDNRIAIAVYSLALSPNVREQSLRAGASRLFEKQSMSLLEVLHEIRELDTNRSASGLSVINPPNGLDLKGRLRALIEHHIEDHFSSVRPFSKSSLMEIYTAVLALEDNAEKRIRAYQTLEILRDSEETSPAGPSDAGELLELRGIIRSMVEEKRSRGEFDVFLCYNSSDLEDVELIARSLLRSGILPWLDHWQVRPGQRWRQILEEAIEALRSAAVFVGQHGVGPWQNLELDALLQEFAARNCPVIPVILSTASHVPPIPLFLRGAGWVDFRSDRSEALQMLIWGITGWRVGGGPPTEQRASS
jgi:CheY-like chemotaxis protein